MILMNLFNSEIFISLEALEVMFVWKICLAGLFAKLSPSLCKLDVNDLFIYIVSYAMTHNYAKTESIEVLEISLFCVNLLNSV